MTDKKPNEKTEEPSGDTPPIPKPTPIKPRKAFVAKKIAAPDKPMEHRTRHIRLSTKESAELFRNAILEFQAELAAQPADDLDKEFSDREKVENFFIRIAKKYSACPSRALGGDLGWVIPRMKPNENMTQNLIEAILKSRKFEISEPIDTELGFHIILVCDTRIHKPAVDPESKLDPRYEALAAKDRPDARAPTRGDIPT